MYPTFSFIIINLIHQMYRFYLIFCLILWHFQQVRNIKNLQRHPSKQEPHLDHYPRFAKTIHLYLYFNLLLTLNNYRIDQNFWLCIQLVNKVNRFYHKSSSFYRIPLFKNNPISKPNKINHNNFDKLHYAASVQHLHHSRSTLIL